MIKEIHFLPLPFPIIRMPNQESNMPTCNRDFYAIFMQLLESKILHLAQTTSFKEKLQKLITNFLIRMQR